MDRMKPRAPKSTSDPPAVLQQNSNSQAPLLNERREKQQQRRKSPQPIVHPDVAHAQTEAENSVYRFNEDSRPMFSPIPKNLSDGEDSPRGFNSNRGTPTTTSSKEKTSFPAIHVEKCEKSQASYVTSTSPEPLGTHTSESDMEVDNNEAMSQGSRGSLNVPSPYLHRNADGRVVMVTQDSNRGLLGSWSRSEGNLPEAIRRSSSSPGGHSNLLDIRYRPDWQPRPGLRPSSDVALHELRREGQRSPTTPRRLPSRLEPLPSLSKNQRTLSANSLQTP